MMSGKGTSDLTRQPEENAAYGRGRRLRARSEWKVGSSGPSRRRSGSHNSDDADRPQWGRDTTKLAEYEYRHEDGSYAFEIWKGRNPDGEKVFITKRANTLSYSDRLNPEDHRDYFPGMGDEKPILYRLPELIAADPEAWVFVVEGEKDVDTAVSLGLVATTNPFGALKWRDEFSPYLKGRKVAVIADKDDRGRKHAAMVARSITGHAAVLSMPDLPHGKDLSEWVETKRSAGRADDTIVAALVAATESAVTEVEADVADGNLTDLGNARRLVRRHGKDLRYIHGARQWIVWKDGHWRIDRDGEVKRLAKATVEQMFDDAKQIKDEDRRAAVRRWSLSSQSKHRLEAMVDLAQSEAEVALTPDKLDSDPMLLGVRNGAIDLRTREFRTARQEDYITKLAGIDYMAEADCPNWKAFLKWIAPENDEQIAYLKRSVGYTLSGLTGEEVMFVLWGNGSNGKSTFRETVLAMMGDYACAADQSLLIQPKSGRGSGATPELARLVGMRLVTVNETAQDAHIDEGRVKFITSHDKITARNLYQGLFDFTPTHKTFLTTNHKPVIKDNDLGIWRRIHLIPFTCLIPEEKRDKYFREKHLLPELPGILNWALEGWSDYQSIGLKPPTVVQQATKEYREDMDWVGQWIEERCSRIEDSNEKRDKLYADFKYWALKNVGWAMTNVKFGRLLEEKGVTIKGAGRGQRKGLQLLVDNPQDDVEM